MKMLLIRTNRLFLASLLFGAAVVAPLSATDDVPATGRRVAATTALAAQEYRNGVRDGKVIASAEVEESKLFLTEARRAAELLPVSGGRETVAAIDGLLALVSRTASPDQVDAQVRALAATLNRTWQASLQEKPSSHPSPAPAEEPY